MGVQKARAIIQPPTVFMPKSLRLIGVKASMNSTIAKRVLLQLGAGAKKAPFLLCDQRYVPVLSGRLEYPANNHCIRIRVTIGKHRALPLPQ